MMLLSLLALWAAQAAPYPRPLAVPDQKIIATHVGQKLKDDVSARYRWPKQREDVGYCGWVNAKNSYGAYGGFQQFYVLGAQGAKGRFIVTDVTLSTGDPDDVGTAVVEKMCQEAGYDTSTPPIE